VGFPLLPDGRFPIAGWLSPPMSHTNDARYAEYAAAGFNVVLPAWQDPLTPESNNLRLDLASHNGLFLMLRDDRVHPDEATRPGWQARVDSVIAAYSEHPALLGYFLADEPNQQTWPSLAALTQYFAERDVAHPTYINMLGRPEGGGYDGLPYLAWLDLFVERVRPPFFSVDHYVIAETYIRPQFCAGLGDAAEAAAKSGVPWWSIVQLTAHLDMRTPTPAEMDWQANLSLAHGARGLVWFTYWTPPPDLEGDYRNGPIAFDGTRTPVYDQVASTNARVQELGRELAPLRWLGTRHAGSIPQSGTPLTGEQWIRSVTGGDVTVGFFRDPRGRDYALIVNRDRERNVPVHVAAARRLQLWTGSPGAYTGGAATVQTLVLSAGGAALVRGASAVSSVRRPTR
jgi:hypothetical protein